MICTGATTEKHTDTRDERIVWSCECFKTDKQSDTQTLRRTKIERKYNKHVIEIYLCQSSSQTDVCPRIINLIIDRYVIYR